MRKFLFTTALIVGFVFDLLFWGKTPGISFPIFVIITLAAGFFLLHKENLYPSKISALLLIPILFFVLMVSFRKEILTASLDFFLTLVFMYILAMTYLSGLWISFNIWGYVANFFHFVGGILTLPLLSSDTKNDRQNLNKEKSWLKSASPIIRGVLLAIPILLIFSALLSSADLIFANQLKLLFVNINLENLPEYIFRGFLILFTTYIFIGVILYSGERSGKIRLQKADKPKITPFLGSTETNIILGSVVLLFSAFVLIQFKYFFFGQTNISIEGFTYAEYARRGFGELVAVAVFSIVMIKSLSVVFKRESRMQIRLFTRLTTGLVGLVLIILVSAYQRLALYESAYGFTRSRTYVHVFIIWLGIYLISIALMEIFEHQGKFANTALFIATGFVISLNLLNVDKFIVNRNINRAVQGEALDVSYLTSLSNDAIPVLTNHLMVGDLPEAVREGAGATLKCFQYDLQNSSERNGKWQSFHFSNWHAEHSLEDIQKELSKYQIDDKDWPVTVKSPDGKSFSCRDYTGFN